MKTIKDIYFDDKTSESDLKQITENLKKEGFRIVGAEPIEKIEIKIVGRRFTLEKN